MLGFATCTAHPSEIIARVWNLPLPLTWFTRGCCKAANIRGGHAPLGRKELRHYAPSVPGRLPARWSPSFQGPMDGPCMNPQFLRGVLLEDTPFNPLFDVHPVLLPEHKASPAEWSSSEGRPTYPDRRIICFGVLVTFTIDGDRPHGGRSRSRRVWWGGFNKWGEGGAGWAQCHA